MSLVQKIAGLLMMMMMAITSDGAVYKVGDSAGWTPIGNVDYKKWAASKNFKVGDTIIFEYDPQFHNVMKVTQEIYNSCNASAGPPLAIFKTGNDSIKISEDGHHFFMCGFPGHCQAGQKVDVNVIRVSAKAPPPSSAMASPPPTPPNKAAAPFMAPLGLIGLAMPFLALAGF